MNTLMIGCHGIDSTGSVILDTALHKKWPRAKHVTLLSSKPCPWTGSGITKKSSITPKAEKDKGPHAYSFSGFPMDAVLFGLHNPKELLGFDRQFDLVFAGVKHHKVVGPDILFSSDTMACAVAAKYFGVPCVVIAADTPEGTKDGDIDPHVFAAATRFLPQILNGISPIPGQTLVINIPTMVTNGIVNVPAALYSGDIPAKANPYARRRQTDMSALEKGFVTLVEVNLEMNLQVAFA